MMHPFDLLATTLRDSPRRTRFTFYSHGHSPDIYDGARLLRESGRLAAALIDRQPAGSRVLLPHPPGPRFLVGFLACIRAGLIPVPVPPPKPGRSLSRYQLVAEDCDATLAVTTQRMLSTIDVGTSHIDWVDDSVLDDTGQVSGLLNEQSTPRSTGRDDGLLFLQYTSGSTHRPKGVMVTVENLIANLEVISRGFELDRLETPQRVVCSWLPNYHDMGLIGVLMSALVHDGQAVLMSPTAFLQRPGRWLDAISDHRASVTVAPCFGYQLAAAKAVPGDWLEGVTADSVATHRAGKSQFIRQGSELPEAERWDLSSLTVAACGAEPIDPAVLETFAERFAPCGFDRRAFYPCYGLAESTLMVTGASRQRSETSSKDESDGSSTSDPPTETSPRLGRENPLNSGLPGAGTLSISQQSLRSGRACDPLNLSDQLKVVSCGIAGYATQVRIVDPETRRERSSGFVGEIWVQSASVAAGYWNAAEATAEMFAGRLVTGEGPFLRTGDLGFLDRDQLYVTGRLKDLIIIRGQNHYPHDIERTATQSVDALSDSYAAAFSVTGDQGESLVLVVELSRQFDRNRTGEAMDSIRAAVAVQNDVLVSEVVLIRNASMPRTSSGKIQRGECRRQFLDGQLKIIDQWQASGELDPHIFPDLSTCLSAEDPQSQVRSRIERSLVTWLSRQGGYESNRVDPNLPFAECGIDSLMAVEMSDQLQRWLGVELSPVIAWSHPNAATLADYLASQLVEHEDQESGAADQSLESLLSEIEAMDEGQALLELQQPG